MIWTNIPHVFDDDFLKWNNNWCSSFEMLARYDAHQIDGTQIRMTKWVPIIFLGTVFCLLSWLMVWTSLNVFEQQLKWRNWIAIQFNGWQRRFWLWKQSLLLSCITWTTSLRLFSHMHLKMFLWALGMDDDMHGGRGRSFFVVSFLGAPSDQLPRKV